MAALRSLSAAAILIAGLAAPALAQPSSSAARKLLAPFQPVVAQVNAATVRVMCDDKDAALGTIVAADGLILTKASELRGAVSVKLGDGSVLDAETISIHKPTDLALLKIDIKGLKPVRFEDSKKVPIGNWLAAGGIDERPTAVGIVSVVTRNLSGADARDLLSQNRGYLGILLPQDDGPDGVARVDGFPAEEPSAALKAGVKKGDVIVELNGRPISSSEELRGLLENYKPDEKVNLKVRRGSEELKFTVTLRARKQNRSDIQNNMGGSLSGRRTGFPTVLQTDMILDPKNCGGPVVDLDGKVLGVAIARAGRVETWILPSEVIRPVLADMRAGKFPAVAGKKRPPLPAAPAPRIK